MDVTTMYAYLSGRIAVAVARAHRFYCTPGRVTAAYAVSWTFLALAWIVWIVWGVW